MSDPTLISSKDQIFDNVSENANMKIVEEQKNAAKNDGKSPLRCEKCGTLKYVNFASFVNKEPDKKTIRKVMVKFIGSPCCPHETMVYLQKMAGVYGKKEPFVVLYDASTIGMVGADVVKQQAVFMRNHDNQTKMYMLRCAIVLDSLLAKQILNTLFVMKPPACQLKLFKNTCTAKKYLGEVCEK